jgi:LysM repeat protein
MVTFVCTNFPSLTQARCMRVEEEVERDDAKPTKAESHVDAENVAEADDVEGGPAVSQDDNATSVGTSPEDGPVADSAAPETGSGGKGGAPASNAPNRYPPLHPTAQALSGSHATEKLDSHETLSELAHRYGTSIAAIAAANGISDPHKVPAGATVVIPLGNGGGKPPTSVTLKEGETIEAVASRFGVSVDEIRKSNRHEFPKTREFKAGDTFWVPANAASPASPVTQETPATPDTPETPANSENPQTQPSALPLKAHTLAEKETLPELANRYLTTVDVLLAANPSLAGKDQKSLPAGTVVQIPIGKGGGSEPLAITWSQEATPDHLRSLSQKSHVPIETLLLANAHSLVNGKPSSDTMWLPMTQELIQLVAAENKKKPEPSDQAQPGSKPAESGDSDVAAAEQETATESSAG